MMEWVSKGEGGVVSPPRSTCYLSGAGQVRPVLLSVWKGLIEDTENKCDLEWDEKGGGERDEKCGRMKEN